ncbi:MAG: type II toxin-antitoxin system VapC family toxin [Chitinophagaceae bacterium]
MAGNFLIDTNVAIDYLDDKLPNPTSDVLDTEYLNMSVITRMELLAWRNATTQHLSTLEEFIRSTNVYGLDESVILKSIELKRNHTIKLPDAIIAATAIVCDKILLTRNTNDFKNIEKIQLLNPWNQNI